MENQQQQQPEQQQAQQVQQVPAHHHHQHQHVGEPQLVQRTQVIEQQVQQQPIQVVQQQPAQVLQTSQVITQQPVVVQQQPVVVQQSAVQASRYQAIKGESRVEYIPYQTKHIEYDEVERSYMEKVAVPVKKIVPQSRVITKVIPEERVVTDYQAVEYQKEYVPRIQYDTVTEQVPVERVEYVPVQRTEYVAQEVTEYITQNKQVEKVHYDEVEYRVQPQQQVVTQAAVVQQPAQTVVTQSPAQVLSNSQVVLQQPQVYSSQFIQQPLNLQTSQAKVLATNVQVPEQYQPQTYQNGTVPVQQQQEQQQQQQQ